MNVKPIALFALITKFVETFMQVTYVHVQKDSAEMEVHVKVLAYLVNIYNCHNIN